MDASYGLWQSPITAELASSASITFQDVVVDGQDVYWSEMRPQEGGRFVIVQYQEGACKDRLPFPYNARTRVHEYGGAAFTVSNGIIYFVHFQDQRIYEYKPNQQPRAITQPGQRFAELKVTPFGLVAIGEEHHEKNVENFIACIDIKTGHAQKIAQGFDFYAHIAINHDFSKIAYISWNHPNMPWDNTQLWVGDLQEGRIVSAYQVDKHYPEQSFLNPQWGPHNELIVLSDKSNWWNLYHVQGETLTPIFKVESELGQPLWNLGDATWGYYQGGLICTFVQDGKTRLFQYNAGLREIGTDYIAFSQMRVFDDKVALIAKAQDKPAAIALLENEKLKIIRESTTLKIDPGYISKPEHITFNSHGRKSHAFFYRPQNKDYKHAEIRPPLIVRSHGGPTANSGNALNLEVQYWTSRGFAFADVNYAGSSGYGRAYRKSLEQNWGIYDVEDCVACVEYLKHQNEINPQQLAITGGSAGGYTTLAALTFTDVFHVGASHYGVSSLEALVQDTHKFESHYLDKLIGYYPQEKNRYFDRSPICHVQSLNAPIIFFQGAEDKIVLPNQSEMMVEALQKKGIQTAYFLFPEEQHGFRKAENKITALKEQYQFFIDVLGIVQ